MNFEMEDSWKHRKDLLEIPQSLFSDCLSEKNVCSHFAICVFRSRPIWAESESSLTEYYNRDIYLQMLSFGKNILFYWTGVAN